MGGLLGALVAAALAAVGGEAGSSADPSPPRQVGFESWGAEIGGGVAFDTFSQANAYEVISPLWLVEVRLRSPWGLSLGLVGMFASGTNDPGGDGNGIDRQMLGVDLAYSALFPSHVSGFAAGRGWVGLGAAAGSSSYAHVDEPYASHGHVRELFLEGGVDLLLLRHIAVGLWLRAAVGDSTTTVYSHVGPTGPVGSPPGQSGYTVFNLGVRVLLGS
jgi:hypothetical protein